MDYINLKTNHFHSKLFISVSYVASLCHSWPAPISITLSRQCKGRKICPQTSSCVTPELSRLKIFMMGHHQWYTEPSRFPYQPINNLANWTTFGMFGNFCRMFWYERFLIMSQHYTTQGSGILTVNSFSKHHSSFPLAGTRSLWCTSNITHWGRGKLH